MCLDLTEAKLVERGVGNIPHSTKAIKDHEMLQGDQINRKVTALHKHGKNRQRKWSKQEETNSMEENWATKTERFKRSQRGGKEGQPRDEGLWSVLNLSF